MKIKLLAMLFFLFLTSQAKGIDTALDNCTEWESFTLTDGTKTNLNLRFCTLTESESAVFELKDDNDKDTKRVLEIEFNNGKKISTIVVIHHNDKAKFEFGANTSNYLSGVLSWKFDKIEYGACGSFKAPKFKITNKN